MKIGFIDYYLDEWHANNYPNWIREASNGEMEVALAYGMIDSPIGGRTNVQWCADMGIAQAATIAEVCASATPCIMVPSPNVTNDHQEKNARILEQHGAAVVLHENHCDGELLFRTTQELLADAPRRASMRTALQELAVVDSASRICDIILNLAKTHKS